MGGKKRPERSIRSARKDGICVSAVGDQRIGSSRSAGVSLGHARSESHSSGAPFLCPAPRRSWLRQLGPRPRTAPLRSTSPCSATWPKHASSTGRYSTILHVRGPRPFYRTRSYGFSMRGRTTDIDRLITCVRGGSHGPRR